MYGGVVVEKVQPEEAITDPHLRRFIAFLDRYVNLLAGTGP